MLDNIIVVDVETTGLDTQNDQLINIGAIHAPCGAEFFVECYPNLAFPYEHDPKAIEINGVSKSEFVARATDNNGKYVSQEEALKQLISFCMSHTDKPYLAGANIAGFDIPMLKLPMTYNDSIKWPLGYHFLDISSLAYGVFHEPLGLARLSDRLGIAQEQAIHTGISGARHELKIIELLFERIKEMNECVGNNE